jgi:hypothetical protein
MSKKSYTLVPSMHMSFIMVSIKNSVWIPTRKFYSPKSSISSLASTPWALIINTGL